MPRQAKKFTFVLTPEEVAEIHFPPLSSSGGRQSLERSLYRQLQETGNIINLDDKGLGQLLRIISLYDGTNGGGLQARLHRAFSRSLREIMSL